MLVVPCIVSKHEKAFQLCKFYQETIGGNKYIFINSCLGAYLLNPIQFTSIYICGGERYTGIEGYSLPLLHISRQNIKCNCSLSCVSV